MGGGKSRTFERKKTKHTDTMKSLVGETSYSRNPSYKKQIRDILSASESIRKIQEERAELRKQERESGIKPKSEWTDEDEIMALIGVTPRYGNANNQYRINQLNKREEALIQKLNIAKRNLNRMDAEEFAKQSAAWKKNAPTLTPIKDIKTAQFKYFSTDPKVGYVNDAIKSGKAMLVSMSPKEYLQRVSYEIFTNPKHGPGNVSTLERTIRGTNSAAVKKYMGMMKSGVKFNTPYLNMGTSDQEGRHRAIAAYRLGVKKIPVWIIF